LIALVAVAVGCGLIVIGARSLAHGHRTAGRLGIWVGLLTTVAVLTWTLAPSVAATFGVPTIGAVADDGLGIGAVQVTFPAGDDVTAAWYRPTSNGATVVLRHGSGASAASVSSHAQLLAAHGYGLLVTDARGHGASTGPAMDFGWFGDEDISAALDHLERLPEVSPGRIALFGLSMGGEESVGAIGSDPRVAAVVAEGVTGRTAEDRAWLTEVYGWRGQVQSWLDRAQDAVTAVLTPASKPASLANSASAASPRPILLVTGGEVPDERRAAEFIAEGSRNVTIETIPGAGHVGGLATDEDLYEQIVIDFLGRALAP
jgi:pimeloyl-ACP methyl ester carboxylesterase